MLGMAATVALLALTGPVRAQSIQEQRDNIHATVNDTLNRLYAAQPSAKQATANAAGYGVFNDFGMKIFFAGGDRQRSGGEQPDEERNLMK